MFEINEKKENDIIIVKISGNLSWEDESEINRYFQNIIYKNACKIIIDARGLEYFSSSSIGAFIQINKLARNSNTEIVFSNLSEFTQKIFSSVQMDKIYKIFKNKNEAVDYLKSV
ncbi:MAG: STAS domain-containing protein [Candidatus Muiribacteriota bacterium]